MTQWHNILPQFTATALLVGDLIVNNRFSKCASINDVPQQSAMIFMGSGSSSGSPMPYCLLARPEISSQCKLDRQSAMLPPEENPNYRNNPSVLIRYVTKSKEKERLGIIEYKTRYIQIDVGKTFRESVLRWYLRHNVSALDGIVLSHDHADAMLGLDDVRGLQYPGAPATVVMADARTLNTIKRVFPYLYHAQDKTATVVRHVASLEFRTFSIGQKFVIADLEMLPFPVIHGEDYVSNGFMMGPKRGRTVYISDCSRVPAETMDCLKEEVIDVLVIDALLKTIPHITHFSMMQAIDLARELKPRRTLLVGMSSSLEYTETNRELKLLLEKEGLDIQLARDGLSIDLDLGED